MVLMLLSTLPPPSFQGCTGATNSPLSPCSNPFSNSFAAFLKPVFGDSSDDLDILSGMSSVTTSTWSSTMDSSNDSKPSFTYPWLKPSPLSLKTRKKALPPLPPGKGSSPSSTRRVSSPVRAPDTGLPTTERTLTASFGGAAHTRAARRSRYDSVPSMYIERQASPSPLQTQQQSGSRSPPPPSLAASDATPASSAFSSTIISPTPNRTPPNPSPRLGSISPSLIPHSPRLASSPRPPSPNPNRGLPPYVSDQSSTHSASAQLREITARRDSVEANKLDMSIALAGVELDMSGCCFTPSMADLDGEWSTGDSAGESGSGYESFSSSVSSIFDTPASLVEEVGQECAQGSVSSATTVDVETETPLPVNTEGADGADPGDGSMLVPLTFDFGIDFGSAVDMGTGVGEDDVEVETSLSPTIHSAQLPQVKQPLRIYTPSSHARSLSQPLEGTHGSESHDRNASRAGGLGKNMVRWPRRGSSATHKRMASQRELEVLPSVVEA